MTDGITTPIKSEKNQEPVCFGLIVWLAYKKARASQPSETVPPNRAELLRRSLSLGSETPRRILSVRSPAPLLDGIRLAYFGWVGFLLKSNRGAAQKLACAGREAGGGRRLGPLSHARSATTVRRCGGV